jgi:glutamate synthase (NADPH/NADH) small chain
MTIKERLAIPPQEMRMQNPNTRLQNMNEIALGFTEEQAVREAERCLNCKNAPCMNGCPVGVQIPRFIVEIQKHNFKAAIDIIKETNALPAVCGRVCPQEKQCQLKCTVGLSLKSIEKAVAVGRLERFAADWERTNKAPTAPTPKPSIGKRVGIIGSGPAGLTAAADLARTGWAVTVFEALHKPGGVMIYGIPEFRLPKSIVAEEINALEKLNVKFEMNFLAGRTKTLDALLKEFDAIFIGAGAGLPKFLNIPGENLAGVFSANEYLTRANLMKAWNSSAATPFFNARTVAVVGGGNVAMDAARTALRLGAQNVHVVYRRERSQMPARTEEVEHAVQEGVIFDFLRNPTEILGGENARVNGLILQKFELGELDASGRRKPVPIADSEYRFDCDTVISALGNEPNPLLTRSIPTLKADRRGCIIVDNKQKTSLDAVYAGGDVVQGAATVILAMGDGRRAADAINELLGI